MGVKQILVDDFDGQELPDNTEPVEITFDGKKHKVYMSAKNSERFMDFLTGTAPLVRPSYSSGGSSARSGATTKTGRAPVNDHGNSFHDVRAWAIANSVKGKTGAPITEKTRIINQEIYDAYRDAHQ